MTHPKNDDPIETMLTRHFAPSNDANADSSARVLRALSAQPLPRQRGGAWLRWPAVLLDLDFTPAWPRVAALAACAALGFVVGIAGLDAKVDEAAAVTVASADLPSLVYDAEPLTGLRP